MKKRILIGIAATLCICVICVLLPEPYTSIHHFSYAELPVRMGVPSEYYPSTREIEKDLRWVENCPKDDLYGNVVYEGFAAIVTVQYSTSYQFRVPQEWHRTQKEVELLKPYHVYDDLEYRKRLRECIEIGKRFIMTEVEWIYSGFVVTTAKIEKIICTSENLKFKVGDTIRIEESYMVWDQRTPHLVEWYASQIPFYGVGVKGKYAISSYGDYAPLEVGETYLVGARAYNTKAIRQLSEEDLFSDVAAYHDLADLQPRPYIMYCLSDKTKQAGTYKSPEQLDAACAYVAEHFGY